MCSFEHYYRETSNGHRLPVTEYQWMIDRHSKGYVQVIAQPGLTIYKVQL